MLKRHAAPALISAGLLSALCLAPAARAEGEESKSAVTAHVIYKGDIAGVVAGGSTRAGRYLDNLELTADASLEKLFGWTGAHVFAHILSNSGGAPNELAGTIQGVDNIEVARPRTKLYQLWIEQDFGGDTGSVLAGLYDLNSEFYHTDAAGLLIAPAFGVGSELAATGPNGPSIFPSTALALRVRWTPAANQQFQAAVLNARAGVVGDPESVDVSFDDGALIIGEWAYGGDTKFKLGAWRYTSEQADIRDLNAMGAPEGRAAQGIYASLERPLWGGAEDARQVTGFVRVGAADGNTTPFRGGWQAGLLVSRVFAARPDSALSFGFDQALMNAKFRANALDASEAPAHAESAFEITYADKLGEHLTLQPDLQIIHDAGADSNADDVAVATLRFSVEF